MKSVFFLLLLGAFSAFGQLAPGAWIQKLQPLQDSSFVATPDNGHTALVASLNNARSSIWMQIYHLTDPEIIQALIAAKAKGVDVQIIMDAKSLQSPAYASVMEQLTKGNVPVTKSSAAFSITHSKSFCIDQKYVFISTMNFIKRFDSMRDFGLFSQEPGLVKEWISVFQADLENAKTNGNITPPLNHPNFVVSPVNAEQKIVDLINAAHKSILGMVENIGSNSVINALSQARSRGVSVQLITPECDLNTNPLYNYPTLYTLAKAGGEMRVMPSPSSPQTPYIHAKTLVIDSSIAFLGSENFSMNSLTQAREMGVVFTSTPLVQTLEKAIQVDWAKSLPLPPTPPTICKAPGA